MSALCGMFECPACRLSRQNRRHEEALGNGEGVLEAAREQAQPQPKQAQVAPIPPMQPFQPRGLAQYTCPQCGKKFLSHGVIKIAHQEAKLPFKSPIAVDAILCFLMR